MAQLTLHQAMAVILRGRGWMDRDEIARELAERDLYRRPKDGQPAPSYQLGMRMRRYPHWFEARGPGGGQVRLVPGGPRASVTAPRTHSGSSRRRTAPSRPVPSSVKETPASSSPRAGDAEAIRGRRARAARKYKPAEISTLLVAEAPPAAPERYFYFEDVRAHDSL